MDTTELPKICGGSGASGLCKGSSGLHWALGSLDWRRWRESRRHGQLCWMRVSCLPAHKSMSKRVPVSSLCFQHQTFALGRAQILHFAGQGLRGCTLRCVAGVGTMIMVMASKPLLKITKGRAPTWNDNLSGHKACAERLPGGMVVASVYEQLLYLQVVNCRCKRPWNCQWDVRPWKKSLSYSHISNSTNVLSQMECPHTWEISDSWCTTSCTLPTRCHRWFGVTLQSSFWPAST